MLLSIIIPAYNVEKYIERCILSTQNQDLSRDEYEVIIVNDGSPDRSLEIAERLAVIYSNIRVLSQPNRGLSAARNTGMDNAIGDYIFFIDSDDWIEENSFGKISRMLIAKRPDILSICAADLVGGNKVRRFTYRGLDDMIGPEAMRYIVSTCAPFHIVRRDFMTAHGFRFFEGIYHEDVELVPRVLYFADKVSFIDDVVYLVYPNASSITRTVRPKKVIDTIKYVCPSLDAFMRAHVKEDDKDIFRKKICSVINTVLRANYPLSPNDMVLINGLFRENSYLFQHFRQSRSLKHKFEGCLFGMMPSKTIQLFNLLKRIVG